MNIRNVIYQMMALSVIVTSCQREELSEGCGNDHSDEYVRIELTSSDKNTKAVWADADGSGNLSFHWENIGIDSKETESISLLISDGSALIPVWESSLVTSGRTPQYHSPLSVKVREDDHRRADFQTVWFYRKNDLENAKFCCAYNGNADINDEDMAIRTLAMPSRFTQTRSQDPSFLRDYMHMYASGTYEGNGTKLDFKHIPSTLRLIITNTGSSAVSLQEVSVYVSSASASQDRAVASSASEMAFDKTTGDVSLSFSGDTHEKVTTTFEGNDRILDPDEKYTAYSIVLPLSYDDAFKGKAINFNVKADGKEFLAFQLDAEKLAKANGGVCNWVSGKSYSIRLNVGDEAKVSGEIIADNRIEISTDATGTFTLRYEDSDGKPLADYAEICTLTAESVAYYEDFINANIAPEAAYAIGVYDASGNRLGSISIAGLKPEYSEPAYSFGLLADVHCQDGGGTESISDFQRALKFFGQRNVALTCICGDITQEGTEYEMNLYRQVVDACSPWTPVYATSGNHDCTSYGQLDENLWKQYSGIPLVYEHAVKLPGGGSDHFLFLGMSYWEFTAPYLESHILWLEDKLEKYRNERCFVITHLFFPDRAGNMNDIYPTSNWLAGAQLDKLQSLCDNYVNSIWISGHSHWKWSMQKYQDRANVHRSYGIDGHPSSGWCIHVPSCSYPTDSDGISTREGRPAESEGAIVHVYEDHFDIMGIDLKQSLYLPIGTYRIDTKLEEVPEKEDNTTQLYLKAENFAYYKGGHDKFTVRDVEDMPGYVEVTFTGTSQGYYVTNSTFVPSSSSKVSIIVEDVQAYHDGKPISVPEKVGFYGGDYFMTTTNSAYVNKESGVQFQTSSSCGGPWPLTLRMKVLMQFY